MNRRVGIALAALLSATGCGKEDKLAERHHSRHSKSVGTAEIRPLIHTAAANNGIEIDGLDRFRIDDTGRDGETVVVVHATLTQLSGFFESLCREAVEFSQIVFERTGPFPSTPDELGCPDDKVLIKTEIKINPHRTTTEAVQLNRKFRPTRMATELWAAFSATERHSRITRFSIKDDRMVIRGRTANTTFAGKGFATSFFLAEFMRNFNWKWSKSPDWRQRVSEFELVGVIE